MSKFHFIKNKKITLIILATVLVIGIASFLISGFNIDIDFSGGTEVQMDLGTEVTDEVCDQVNDIVAELFGSDYVSSTTKSTADSNAAIIRTGTKALDTDQQAELQASLVKAFPNANEDNIEVNIIQPTVGDSLTRKAILAVAIAVALMLVYIWFRFELNSGIAAVVCLAHDLFVMFTVYSLFNIPLNTNIIAALLTILGYSINATIIVFDRVRELKKLDGGKSEFGDVVNNAIHSTFARSINTTITTLLTIGMIYILGVDSIKDFALPLIVGIFAGLFSSVFLAGMIWDTLNKYIKPKAKKTK